MLLLSDFYMTFHADGTYEISNHMQHGSSSAVVEQIAFHKEKAKIEPAPP